MSRRALLAGASLAAIVRPATARAAPGAAAAVRRVEPVSTRHIRLRPSVFADAFAANRRYLLSLDPERLLHNFYVSAGLPVPGPVYGGWEAQGIAGHSLGHWLSACALTIANTGDRAVAARLDHALAEMARIQAAHGDGYLGGTTVVRDGETVDGKVVFEEVRRGDIRSGGFDLNGGWVPLYTWHKVHAGLLDAHTLAGNRRALPIALGVAGYLAGVLEPLDDGQMQLVLSAEHGGLNESYAETHALTGNPRWLRMAEKIRHKAVLDPLAARQDRLDGLHANTQIPKVIGLARLHEITGSAADATAARFFHDTVTRHHSYVIGGNSDREHFGPPDMLAGRVTEATCEACNSYNMLKLTRHLYAWQPDAAWFDFYERVQLNHILAHQRPDDGRFVYFMPLAAGARRVYSSAEDSFWCCVGSGMESHARHADSIWWSDAAALYLNLYIPSDLDWPDRGIAATLDTAGPVGGPTAEEATLRIRQAPRRAESIAFRLPGWAKNPTLRLNGAPVVPTIRDGYAVLTRRWRAGDSVTIRLPATLSVERLAGVPDTVAFVHGPLVLAADLGSADAPFEGVGPALIVGAGLPGSVAATAPNRFSGRGALGEPIVLRPFFAQYDRRTAVYFPTFTPDRWATEKAGYLAAQDAARTLARRTVDTLYLGEMQPERDHAFAAERSEVVNWNGRSARRLPSGQRMTMTLARRPGPATLRLTVWGEAIGGAFEVTVDGERVATIERSGPAEDRFAAIDVALPPVGAQGRPTAIVAFDATKGELVLYEVRMLAGERGEPV